MRHEVIGNGHPVVLVHGLSGSARWWLPIVPELAGRYRVHVLELPGFGARGRSRPRFALRDGASWLVASLEEAELARAHLIGHSMGGLICLRVAARHPELVARLALIAPAGLASRRSTVGHVVPLLRALAQSPPALVPVLVRDALHAGPRTLWQASRDLLREDVRADLAAVRCPTLLVWGERDPLVPPTLAEVFRSEIENCRLLLLERAGHVPMFDRPHEVASALSAFLAGEPVGE